MREILFRGKDAKTKRWHTGSLLDLDRDSAYLYIVEPYCHASSLPVFELVHDLAHFVIPETIGQYTGMTDKNGKKIFEGDIVKATYRGNFDRYAFEVVFDDCRFALRKGGVVVEMNDCLRREVIGNIHDNPELLKDARNGTA